MACDQGGAVCRIRLYSGTKYICLLSGKAASILCLWHGPSLRACMLTII